MKFNQKLEFDKPREKMLKYGASSLTDTELLEIILRTGSKTESVEELSTRVLKETNGITNLSQIGLNTLLNIKGIKLGKATSIIASFELSKRVLNSRINNKKLNTPIDIYLYYRNNFKNIKEEKFFVLLYDTRKNFLCDKEIFRGTIDQVQAYPREIFKESIKESAKYIILLHNHPSGVVIPSQSDISLTKNIKETGKVLGIEVMDHIIISYDAYYSFFESKILS